MGGSVSFVDGHIDELTDREKLVSWMLQGDAEDEVSETTTQHREYIADLMIANGVVVRERGEWIPYFDGDSIMPERYSQCSNCGSRGWIKRRNFCPNCGADMRREKNECVR